MAKKKRASAPEAVVPKLTETEQDLLWHIEHGYQLETDSLGGEPVLRRLEDSEGICPMSANRNTVKALEERGLITPAKGRDPLTIVWRLSGKAKR
ncbi:MAG TPA: hypothetical protein VK466_08760 [Terriglobales bacterium]|nr:hypothetical protein [Terriglobales bacterium]